MRGHHKPEEHAAHVANSKRPHHREHNPYVGLVVSTGVSSVAMFAVMYSMVDRVGNIYFNISTVYMTGLMTAAMLGVMLATMRHMYTNKRLNLALWGATLGLFALSWVLLRSQAAVNDRQFLRGMIPHHAAALLMVKEATLTDPRVRALGEQIVSSQEREIAQMKAILADQKP